MEHVVVAGMLFWDDGLHPSRHDCGAICIYSAQCRLPQGAFCVGNLDGRLGFGFATALLRYGSAEIFFRTDSIRHLADTICIFDLHEHFAFGQVHPHTSHGRFCCKH